jgi:hypothetical protein
LLLHEWLGEPGVDELGVRLKVEEEAPGRRLVAKSLDRGCGGGSKEDGIVRKGERITVPVEDGLGGSEVLEEGISGGSWGEGDRTPADLGSMRVRLDRGAESGGEELRSKADAKVGNTGVDGAGNRRDFSTDIRVAIGVVDALGSAEGDDGTGRLKRREVVGNGNIDVPVGDVPLSEGFGEATQSLPRGVAEDEEGRG